MSDFLLSLGVGVVAIAAFAGVIWACYTISANAPFVLPTIGVIAICAGIGYVIRSMQ